VHGIHAVLWALEQWLAAQSEPLVLARLDVQFRAPIGTGDRVALDCTEGPGDGTETRLTLAVAGRRTTEVAVVWRAAVAPPVTPPAGGAGSVAPPCAVVAEAELPSAEGTVPVALDEAARRDGGIEDAPAFGLRRELNLECQEPAVSAQS
jgi:hypothetical protein